MKKFLAVLLAPYWMLLFLMFSVGAFFIFLIMLIHSKHKFEKEDWMLLLNAPADLTGELICQFIEP